VRVVVVRHGPAESRDPRKWPDDDHRPLSREGRRETRSAALGLAVLERDVRVVITSPASRARATAEIVRESLDLVRRCLAWPELGPGATAAAVLARLPEAGPAHSTIVLVGHEPQLGELIGLALTGDAVSVTRLGKAGAAAVQFPRVVRPGAGTLEWRLDRKGLAKLHKNR
jgi:phosphohistidine phosphatase